MAPLHSSLGNGVRSCLKKKERKRERGRKKERDKKKERKKRKKEKETERKGKEKERKGKHICWVWWFTPVIPTLWEAKVYGSPEVRSSRSA